MPKKDEAEKGIRVPLTAGQAAAVRVAASSPALGVTRADLLELAGAHLATWDVAAAVEALQNRDRDEYTKAMEKVRSCLPKSAS